MEIPMLQDKMQQLGVHQANKDHHVLDQILTLLHGDLIGHHLTQVGSIVDFKNNILFLIMFFNTFLAINW
jgi:hypothetical protein